MEARVCGRSNGVSEALERAVAHVSMSKSASTERLASSRGSLTHGLAR